MINEKICCEKHLNSVITHVCVSENCFLPLCGKCIKSHNAFHKSENKFPEFETIEDVREICVLKLSEHIEKYKMTLENNNQCLNSQILNDFTDMITQIKRTVNNIMEAFFKDLQVKLTNKYETNTFLSESKNELNSVYDELKEKLIQVQKRISMQIMKDILTTDYDKCLEEFQKKLKHSNIASMYSFLPDNNSLDRFYNEFKLSIEKIFISLNEKSLNNHNKSLISPYKKVSFSEHPVYDITKSFHNNSTEYKHKFPDSPSTFRESPFKFRESQHFENTKIISPRKIIYEQPTIIEEKKIFTFEKTPQKEKTFDDYGDKKSFTYQKNSYSENQITFSTPKRNLQNYKNIVQDFKIEMPDYFKSYLQKKYMHFFQPKSKILHLFELNDINPEEVKYFTKEISIDFLLPKWHKSISTPNGQIYLLGGVNFDKKSTKLNSFFVYSFEANSLIAKPPMKTARSSFGIVHFQNYLYAIGGNIEESQTTAKCEKFSINEERWIDVANLNIPSCNHCVCVFNESCLYKFGGKIDDNFLNKTIEKYNQNINKWIIISYRFENIFMEKKFKLLASSACCQVNDSQILVFGGVEEEFNKKSDQSFLFEIRENNGKMDHVIKKINGKKICFAEGFWEPNPLINRFNMYTLQNFSNEIEKSMIYLDRRRLLCFNGDFWRCIN